MLAAASRIVETPQEQRKIRRKKNENKIEHIPAAQLHIRLASQFLLKFHASNY